VTTRPLPLLSRSAPAGSAVRSVVLQPGMCGHNSLFVGQIGDWTWETVGELCGTDVLGARTAEGAPTYLSFHYFHIRASPRMHVNRLTFGDRLDVTSRVFGFGSESILTLHKIEMAGPAGRALEPIDPDDFYAYRDQECLYVENFNRWIVRSREGSNHDLVRSSPAGFRHTHLPSLPERYSPRLACAHARARGTFLPSAPEGRTHVGQGFSVEYRIDISRDLNAVGLVYFATYFSIVDWALLQLWRHLGRSDTSYLTRTVLDHRLCYLANADAGSVLRIDLDAWQRIGDPGDLVVNVVLRDAAGDRTVAVATLHCLEGRS
jgi:probable biosynthetic protein (TIGR04098 family)